MPVLDTNYLDQSINQPDIIAAQDPQFVKGAPVYNVSNPHPKYGKDPNILNEFGHTVYPKMIYPNGKDMPGIAVKNADEEKVLMGDGAPINQEPKGPVLNQNGPTIQEYVLAGFKASTYPPDGYASKSTPEEIKVLVDKENATSQGWG